MLRLRIQDDEGQRSEVPVKLDEITIGRDRENTICLQERNISRRHVRLLRDNGHLVVEDTGSSFGTQVNGARIDARAVLHVGDSLRIGDFDIELVDEATAAAAAPELSADGRKPLIPAEHHGRLVVTSQAFGGRELLLDRSPMTIGRSETADLSIDHRSVSAMHVRIDWTAADGYVVEDLESANGVHVNGESYKRVSLRSGDEMELGHVRLRFVGPGESFVWTPSGDEEALPSSTGKKALIAVVVVAIVALIAVWTLVIDRPDTPERATDPSDEAAGPSGRSGEGNRSEEGTQAAAGAGVGEPGHAQGEEPAAGETGGSGASGGAGAEHPVGEGAETGEAVADKEGAPGQGTSGEQVAAVEHPPVVLPGEGPADWMAGAVKAVEARDWKGAIAFLDKVREVEPDNREAESKLLSAKVELERSGRIEEVERRVEEHNYAAAWNKVSDLHTSAAGSVYFERIEELREQVRGAYVTDYLARAEKDLKGGSYDQANGLLGAVLAADPGNAKAKQLRRTAARKLKEQAAAAEAKERAAAKEPVEQAAQKESTEPKEPKEAASTQETQKGQQKKGGDGARLYHEGRTAKIQGNLPLAVDRFKAAAKAGYPDAHKQLGVIYASQGKAQQAVHHYGQYLRMKPGAPDAAAVKTAIERLGGSP